MKRIFILSPASCSGKRSELILNPSARFELAHQVKAGSATITDTFRFLSGLYFRGKAAYASHFGRPPAGTHPFYIITPSRGLLHGSHLMGSSLLEEFRQIPIDLAEPRYVKPFTRDLQKLSRLAGKNTQVVLLGSIATSKYVQLMLEAFQDRLHYPLEFIGRGDMSRGGLMLRAVRENNELHYAVMEPDLKSRRGVRPPKLLKVQSL